MMKWYRDEISPKGLKSLSKYKYSAIDKSPIAKYILQPYWTWVASLFPIWMAYAPNLITFIGFLFVFGNFLVLLIYTPDLETPGPNWIYISFAVGMWIYSTFDNVDGKQARRTGTSSPLGELFDHTVDALNCTTGGLLQAAGIVLGPSYWTVVIIAIASTAFFFATWETYYTGTLYLGIVNGPTEGLLITISTLLISGIYGPEVWNIRVLDVIPASFIDPVLSRMPRVFQSHLSDLIISHFAIYLMIGCLFTFQIPDSLTRVYQLGQQKGFGLKNALANTVSYLLLLGSLAAWSVAPGSKLVSDHIIVFCLAWGIAVARINAWIILNHLTHERFPNCKFLVAPFIIGALLWWIPANLNIQPIFTPKLESIYIYAIFIGLSVEFLLWVLKVIEQLCQHLDIKCFVIPYPVEYQEEAVVESRKVHSLAPSTLKPLTKLSTSPKTTPKKSVAFALVERENEGMGLRRSPRNKCK